MLDPFITTCIILAACGVVGLGSMGFTEAGIPLTTTYHLKGRAGRITGVICMVIALVGVIGYFVLAMTMRN
jgi:hypothetical protein